jgi:two-component system nitrogen regulation sensor histidine kinase NtrY
MMIIFLANLVRRLSCQQSYHPIKELPKLPGRWLKEIDYTAVRRRWDEIDARCFLPNKMTEDLRSNQLAPEGNKQRADQKQSGTGTASTLHGDRSAQRHSRGDIRGQERHFTTVNKSAEKLLNIDAELVLGRHYSEILRTEQLDIIKGLLRDMVMSKKDTISRQVSIPLKYGALALLVNLSLLKDENGEFMGTVVVFDDLTQLTKAQRMAAWREVAVENCPRDQESFDTDQTLPKGCVSDTSPALAKRRKSLMNAPG